MDASEPREAARATEAGDIPLWVLMFGNLVIGSGILAPSSMINELVEALKVSAVDIGALIGWGALVLGVGAPTLAFLTSKLGRRGLLAGCLAVYGVGHAASALAPDYPSLLIIRLLMIAAAAVYTPQAAGTVALMVPPERRASAVAFVFMGWSVASAAVAPALSILSEVIGWRTCFALIAVAAGVGLAGLVATLPKRLYPAPMSLESWRQVVVRPVILLLLATTMIQLAGQFVLFPYAAAEAKRAAGADAGQVAILLASFGVAGLLGSILAQAYVNRLGAPIVQVMCLASMAIGLLLWGMLQHIYPAMVAAGFIWGLGFGGAVSMQQARLIAVAPALAPASVALNTSVLYLGQAVGATLGGQMIAQGAADGLGFVGGLFMVVAIGLSLFAWRRFKA